MSEEVALDRTSTNQWVIRRLDLPEACARRLKAMGLFEGQQIEIARRGNPLIIKAAGSKIALAREIACHVVVGPGAPPASPANDPAASSSPVGHVSANQTFGLQPARRLATSDASPAPPFASTASCHTSS